MALPPKPTPIRWTPSQEIVDAVNKITLYVPNAEGEIVPVEGDISPPYTAEQIGEISAQALITALGFDEECGEASKDFDADPGPAITPWEYKSVNDELRDGNDLSSDLYRWLASGASSGQVTHQNGDGSKEVTLDNQDWLDEDNGTRGILGAPDTFQIPRSVQNEYMINDGRTMGYTNRWLDDYRADSEGNLMSLATHGAFSMVKAGTQSSGMDKIDVSSIPAYVPYFVSNGGRATYLAGTGPTYTLAEYYHQTQVDSAFLQLRATKIFTAIRAVRAAYQEDAEGAQEISNQRAELEALRQRQNSTDPEDALSAEEQARLRALEAGLGDLSDVAAQNNFIADQARGGEDYASEFRSKEQCFLLTKIISLAQANMSRRAVYDTESEGPKAYAVQGTPGQIVSQLTYDPSYSAFYMIPPSRLSYLVPAVKFYQVLHQYYGRPNAAGERETVDLAKPVDFEVPFFQHITNHSVEQIMSGMYGGKGGGVGLKSFEWTYQGSNPASSRRDIKAKLVLHAQSFTDLLEEHRTSLTDSEGEAFQHAFNYTDLAIRRNRDHLQAPDVLYQQLKVVVGWSLPEATTESLQFTPDEVAAIRNSRVTMYLTIIDHSFDIADNGTVDFTIEYRAWVEGAFTSPESNILINENLMRRNAEREEAMRLMREDLSAGSDATCTDEDMAELRRRITNSIQLDKADAHVSLIEGLESNKPHSRVFRYRVPVAEVVSYIRSPNFAMSPTPYQSNVPDADLTSTTGVAADLKSQINFPTSVDFNNSENNPTVEKIMENVYTRAAGGDLNIPYFFLGDIVNVALENINKVDLQSSGGVDALRRFNKMRVLLGPVEIRDPEGQQSTPMQINMADIPISVNYFMEWFMGKIISKQKVSWFLLEFIKDLTKDLVLRTLTSEDCFGGAHRQRAKFTNLYLVGSENSGQDPIGALIASKAGNSNSPTGQSKRFFIDEFSGVGSNMPILAQDAEDEEKPTEGMYHYVLCYASDPVPRQLNGDFTKDVKKGVFHFHIGTNKGIVKRIRFSKTDQPYLREARYFGQGYSGISQLREPYKVSIEMYGNSKVFPGQTIFVDPAGLGYALGRPNEEGSYAHLLGLGGYHMVINVKNVIEKGKYDTTAECVWVYRGSPAGEITTGPDPTTPVRASTECQVWSQVGDELQVHSGYTPPPAGEAPVPTATDTSGDDT